MSFVLSSSSVSEPAILAHTQSPLFEAPSICATHADAVVSPAICGSTTNPFVKVISPFEVPPIKTCLLASTDI